MNDERVMKAVDTAIGNAVKDERKRILGGLKELKADYNEDENIDPKVKRSAGHVISAVTKLVNNK